MTARPRTPKMQRVMAGCRTSTVQRTEISSRCRKAPPVFCSNYESSVPAKQRPRQTISPGHSAAAPRPSLTSHLKPNGLFSYTDRPGPDCLPSLAPGRPPLSTESRKGAYLSHALSSDASLVPHPPHCTALHYTCPCPCPGAAAPRIATPNVLPNLMPLHTHCPPRHTTSRRASTHHTTLSCATRLHPSSLLMSSLLSLPLPALPYSLPSHFTPCCPSVYVTTRAQCPAFCAACSA
jgi:hypothetical protein